MVEFVRGLAMAFPDRNILLQLKPFLLKNNSGMKFISDCTKALGNVIHTVESPYDIIFRVHYAISDPSSLVAEALQFGCYAFGFDILEKQKSNVIRAYPGLALSNSLGSELINY